MIKDNGIPRVKIVAIAKDEAAYFAEWIHHHLYFGFDAIEILVNRTSDNTSEMLSKICGLHPCVSFNFIDWIDLAPPLAVKNLQYIAYSKAFDDEKNKKNFDYICLIDIDEFWFPLDFSTSIQEVLIKQGHPKCMSFQWLIETAGDRAFTDIEHNIDGYIHPLVKSVIKLDADVTKMSLHLPQFESTKSVLVDGTEFLSSDKLREALHPSLNVERSVFVLHRMFRSPKEYISLLNRGRPSDDIPIKLTRPGYNKPFGKEVKFIIAEEVYVKYKTSRDEFMLELDFHKLLKDARDFVLNRYSSTLELIDQVPGKFLLDLLKVFGGGLNEISFVLTRIRNDQSLYELSKADELVKIALACENIDRDLAIKLMKRAYELRPKGPLIKKKLLEYGVIC